MEGGRLTKPGRREKKKEKNAVVRVSGREREGRRALAATSRVATGPSRQSPLQETQIKADLSSRDLFRAPPTGSLDPGAVLFPHCSQISRQR